VFGTPGTVVSWDGLDGDHAFGDCSSLVALEEQRQEPLPHARQPVYRSGPGYLRLTTWSVQPEPEHMPVARLLPADGWQ
jgi:hypothetical protein